ncbi:hypothetical protein GJAV_G00162390 [Gymnothorax javanicus]|nr:hypothetical protein GJAV_G00162390 [Gymnothorax javanicus]
METKRNGFGDHGDRIETSLQPQCEQRPFFGRNSVLKLGTGNGCGREVTAPPAFSSYFTAELRLVVPVEGVVVKMNLPD